MPSAGTKRERVTFQANQASKAAGGEQVDRFEDQFTVSAQVLSQEGTEQHEQRRIVGENQIRIIVWRSSETMKIDQSWRVVWNGKTWNVSSSIPTEDHSEVVIRAMQVKGAA